MSPVRPSVRDHTHNPLCVPATCLLLPESDWTVIMFVAALRHPAKKSVHRIGIIFYPGIFAAAKTIIVISFRGIKTLLRPTRAVPLAKNPIL